MDNVTKLQCIEREIKMRRQVYPRRVARGSMSMPEAQKEIQIMEAIADDYRRLVTRDAPTLFAGGPGAEPR